MSFELDHTSVVVLGAWNPAIICPQWLQEQGIVKKIPEELKFAFQPLGRAVRFDLAGMTWEASDSRLTIVSRVLRNCGTYAAKVLDRLPHTPLQAIGTNFVFQGPAKDWPRRRAPKIAELKHPIGGGVAPLSQVSWEGVIDLDDVTVLKLTVTEKDDTGVASFNLHRNCAKASAAKAFARKWRADLSVVQAILKDNFGVQIP